MLQALSTRRNRIVSVIILTVCAAFAVSANTVGIPDNPPGILLAYLSATAFIFAFAHPWRNSKRFGYLAAASAIGFLVFVVLHNVLDVATSNLGDSGIAVALLNGAGIGFFLIAIFICPPGVVIGLIGLAIMSRREHHSQQGSSS